MANSKTQFQLDVLLQIEQDKYNDELLNFIKDDNTSDIKYFLLRGGGMTHNGILTLLENSNREILELIHIPYDVYYEALINTVENSYLDVVYVLVNLSIFTDKHLKIAYRLAIDNKHLCIVRLLNERFHLPVLN